MTPKQGDRILIRNVPDDRFKHLFEGQGIIDKTWNNKVVDKGKIYFLTGYLPYKHNGHFSCSGSGNTVAVDKLRFIERAEATFWKFKDNVWKAHNAEHYQELVNIFEIDYKDLL